MVAQVRATWHLHKHPLRIAQEETYVAATTAHRLYVEALRLDDKLRRLPLSPDNPSASLRVAILLVRSMHRLDRRRRLLDDRIVTAARAVPRWAWGPVDKRKA